MGNWFDLIPVKSNATILMITERVLHAPMMLLHSLLVSDTVCNYFREINIVRTKYMDKDIINTNQSVVPHQHLIFKKKSAKWYNTDKDMRFVYTLYKSNVVVATVKSTSSDNDWRELMICAMHDLCASNLLSITHSVDPIQGPPGLIMSIEDHVSKGTSVGVYYLKRRGNLNLLMSDRKNDILWLSANTIQCLQQRMSMILPRLTMIETSEFTDENPAREFLDSLMMHMFGSIDE